MLTLSEAKDHTKLVLIMVFQVSHPAFNPSNRLSSGLIAGPRLLPQTPQVVSATTLMRIPHHTALMDRMHRPVSPLLKLQTRNLAPMDRWQVSNIDCIQISTVMVVHHTPPIIHQILFENMQVRLAKVARM